MKILSPAVRVSLGMVLVTVTLLFIASFFNLIPDERVGLLEGRKKFAESLAVQTTLAASQDNINLVQITFDTLVSRNDDVYSATLMDVDGATLVLSGDHDTHWVEPDDGKSTPTHVEVPIYRDGEAWGEIELAFKPVGDENKLFGIFSPMHLLAALFTIGGFVGYFIFIKRTLRELDPGAVVPERVMSAFNTLAEGVLILDDSQQIVLANTAFSEKIGKPGIDLVGRKATSIGWDIDPDKSDAQLPWTECIHNNTRVIDQPLRFGPEEDKRVFMVNATPIGDEKGEARGVLVTFDDITDLERKRIEQAHTMDRLAKSEKELQDRTIALEFLASRDPLTGCFNRRAFFEKFDTAFDLARNQKSKLACLMVDVDKFKNVNDTYGHHVGDQVIKFVADTLRANSRGDDVVGRMGGEEFCMILPGVDPDRSIAIAERIRMAFQEAHPSSDVPELQITASFGVVQIDDVVEDPADLVNRSDEALYVAKETGRNKTVLWSEQVGEDRANVAQDAAASASASAQPPTLTSAVPTEAKPLMEVQEIDELTGLCNRQAFLTKVSHALKAARSDERLVAIATVDLNSFKRVNGALGHLVGDQLLRAVAKKISSSTSEITGKRTEALVGRLANDEFGLMLTGYDSSKDVSAWMQTLLNMMPDRMDIEGHQVILNFSAGVSVFPKDADEPSVLLQNASAARTEAKRREGNNVIEFFSEQINRSSYKRLWLESQLHDALEKNQFELYYQPKVDLKTGKFDGMEALIRWNHPRVGHVSPAEFIPVAESTGFITQIGEWVLEQACMQGQKWASEGITHLRVAVNLSNVQLRQPDLLQRVAKIIKKSGFSADMLEFEITETAFLNDFDQAVGMVKALRRHGVHFALDDFGTGYSSLNTLKELPFDSIKIDRSFIGDGVPSGADKQILEAIISIAHSLEIPVVAEGVENKSQLALLKTMRCDSVQGFYLGKPAPADKATAMIVANMRESVSDAA